MVHGRILCWSRPIGEAVRPLVAEIQSPESNLTPARATALLRQAQPQLEQARAELDQALAARKSIPAEQLSPRLRSLIVEDLDPALKLEDEGLSVAAALPGLLGAGKEGPKTYLLLAQNGSLVVFFVAIALWGLHMGFTQGLLTTLVAETAPAELRGTAFGASSSCATTKPFCPNLKSDRLISFFRSLSFV